MSTYSQYGSGSIDGPELVANESYSGLEGCYRVMEENAQNEHAVFESIIGFDFRETMAAKGIGAFTESSIEAIQEATISGIWEKVKEFFRKVGEKILGILKSFRDRIVIAFTRDGKTLVKKYEKQVQQKLSDGKFGDKFTYKWCAVKNSKVITKDLELHASIYAQIDESNLGVELGKQLALATRLSKTNDDARVNNVGRGNKANPKAADVSADSEDRAKPLTEDKKTELKENLLGTLSGVGGEVSSKDFLKEFMDNAFEDEDTIEGYNGVKNTEVKSILETGGKILTSLSSQETKLKASIKKNIKAAEDIQRNIKSLKDQRISVVNSNTYAGNVIALGNIETACAVATIGAYSTAVKKAMKQSRAVFVKAALYNGKANVDESALLEAACQTSDFEVDEMFA